MRQQVCYERQQLSRISIHAPLAGCDARPQPDRGRHRWISIHAPLAGCDAETEYVASTADINFNPRTPCGVRRVRRCEKSVWPIYFNPRTPCGVRHELGHFVCKRRHFNPRTPCGVRRALGVAGLYLMPISIHAPLAGCDKKCGEGIIPRRVISIHAPLAGCDNTRLPVRARPRSFQSTHPLRGATGGWGQHPHPPIISIHAPLAGCDVDKLKEYAKVQFQSTHPLRGATFATLTLDSGGFISIHAPLAGCDAHQHGDQKLIDISIHAPLAGCDNFGADAHIIPPYFNPRTPCGVRPLVREHAAALGAFQSTHPLRGATGSYICLALNRSDFNPRTPCGVRRARCCTAWPTDTDFNPRTPCGVRRRDVICPAAS